MRVVFLDIDGVLNSDRFFAEHPWPDGASWWSAAAIDPAAVQRVNALVAQTDAVVVLSSSWRKRASLDELNELLASRGLARPVIDVTPRLYRSVDGLRLTRGDEILAWLAAWSGPMVEAFVALEDEEALGAVEPRCVRVDSLVGLTAGDVERASRMLLE
jgi:HAD domain in Swiss Army Knife RNA repair proteins